MEVENTLTRYVLHRSAAARPGVSECRNKQLASGLHSTIDADTHSRFPTDIDHAARSIWTDRARSSFQTLGAYEER